ncbi:MAG TPA: glycoside hydrolase family 2 protein [Pyrinomonadaceae bacterium]
MRVTIPFWLAALSLLLTPLTSALAQLPRATVAEKTVVPIKTGWQFHEVGKEKWYPASVPGCVHTDLLANKLIDDPFYRDNEKNLQWIGRTDWEYQTTLTVTPELLNHTNVDLVFDGLDTYAQVYLNESLILKADNMFRTWRIDCKQAVKVGMNTLRITFRSPINEILPVMAKMSYELPAPNDQGEKTSPYTRKAPYQYGWDWGPRFVTSGIWRAVSLEAWDHVRVNDIQIVTKDISTSVAQLVANVEIETAVSTRAMLILDNLTTRTVAGKKEVTLEKGTHTVAIEFAIPRPKLWWPNGLGAHPLYTFRARVIIQNRVADQKTTRTGLRTLELRQQVDQSGKSFTFIVNGVPVFAKGGNWIPADSFPSRITREKYRYLVKSVHDTNMNMLRVWGGGIYESDNFYNLADEMGILIWQDFMFACSMYPGSDEFLNNVRAEAVDNVKRLRNHPSIVLWAGNNEIETAWMNWGWRQKFPSSLWDDYKKLFLGVLPDVCAKLDPSRPYWPSSPHGGLDDDPDSMRSGDSHFWRVWHAAEPFTNYEKQSPRFMSEYGFQSFPQSESVDRYTQPADRDIESPIMLAHQRHPRGNQLVREYMLRDFPPPKDFESFLYVSQVLQAEGIRIGAEHLRRIMPQNMGSLYWQIDDCWPVASWSSIDYYQRWKALQYYARRFYSNLLISPSLQNGYLKFFVISDLTKSVDAKLKVSLMDAAGRLVTSFVRDVRVAPLSSRSYFDLNVAQLLSGREPKDSIIYCELLLEQKVVSSHDFFFVPFKEASLRQPIIEPEIVPLGHGFKVTLSSNNFAKSVYLSLPDLDGNFSDNYFDLVPGAKVSVEYHSTAPLSLKRFRDQLKIRSLVDAF